MSWLIWQRAQLLLVLLSLAACLAFCYCFRTAILQIMQACLRRVMMVIAASGTAKGSSSMQQHSIKMAADRCFQVP
jgi:hypothetical protein